MSDSEHSVYEQGEVDSSPEVQQHRRKVELMDDSESQLSISVHSREGLEDDLEDQDEGEDGDESDKDREVIDVDNDDHLHIQPPQVQVKKKEKHSKHRHKDERRRGDHRKDSHRDVRERLGRDRGPVDRDHERSSSHQGRSVHDRLGYDYKSHDRRDKDSERRKIDLQKEAEKREKSRMERERLERLEREKTRERRMREDREREKQQKLRRKEEERQQRKAIEQQKRKEEEKKLQHRGHSSSRSEDKHRGQEDSAKRYSHRRRSRSRSPDRRKYDTPQEAKQRSQKQTGSRSRSQLSPDEQYDRKGRRVREEEPRYKEEEHEEEEPMDEEEEEHDHDEAGHVEENSASEQGSEDSDTDSGSGSDSESSSGNSGTSSNEDEEEQEDVDVDNNEKKHLSSIKSKFDDHSDHEAVEDSPEPSRVAVDDGYIQDTPPMSPVELKPDLPPYFPAIQGCRNVEEFHCLNRIEEGTYGVVYRARDKKTDEIVALKRLKMEKEKEGFPITSLREINTLLKAQHMNIVTVREIVVGSNIDKIYIVMDYVEHDLKSLMETMKQPFLVSEVKTLLRQLLNGVSHLHDNWIIHRDLKTSNLLLSHKGILKIGDFGLAREYGSPLKHYTPIVVTLWYRAPELLLGTKEYSTPIDLWSVGCIFAEFLIMKALWQGKSEIDELQRIFKDLGTPTEKIWPGVGDLPGMKKCTFTEYPYNTLRNKFGSYLTDTGFNLLNSFLTYNPKKRILADEAMRHEYFKESPMPIDPSMFPTWPAKSEQSSRKHVSSPKPPSGGKAYSKLLAGADDEVAIAGGGFHLTNAAKGVSAVGPGFSLKF